MLDNSTVDEGDRLLFLNSFRKWSDEKYIGTKTGRGEEIQAESHFENATSEVLHYCMC